MQVLQQRRHYLRLQSQRQAQNQQRQVLLQQQNLQELRNLMQV
jgi:hypothetical protein